jgi:hypothetical protein
VIASNTERAIDSKYYSFASFGMTIFHKQKTARKKKLFIPSYPPILKPINGKSAISKIVSQYTVSLYQRFNCHKYLEKHLLILPSAYNNLKFMKVIKVQLKYVINTISTGGEGHSSPQIIHGTTGQGHHSHSEVLTQSVQIDWQ